jgi:arylformamidase
LPTLLDLSHKIEPDMPRFGSFDPPYIGAVWTHAEAGERGYQDTTCEVTEVRFVTSIGTYLDAPYHFDPQGADISQLELAQLVLPGLVLDLRDRAAPDAPLPLDALVGLDVMEDACGGASFGSASFGSAQDRPFGSAQDRPFGSAQDRPFGSAQDRQGRALLLCTGWSDYWGQERYTHPPFVPRAMAERLRELRPALVGIDTLVIDSTKDPTRPAHTLLLQEGILIVENLTGLDVLIGQAFTFVAAPAKIAGAAAFPVRAFAMLGT